MIGLESIQSHDDYVELMIGVLIEKLYTNKSDLSMLLLLRNEEKVRLYTTPAYVESLSINSDGELKGVFRAVLPTSKISDLLKNEKKIFFAVRYNSFGSLAHSGDIDISEEHQQSTLKKDLKLPFQFFEIENKLCLRALAYSEKPILNDIAEKDNHFILHIYNRKESSFDLLTSRAYFLTVKGVAIEVVCLMGLVPDTIMLKIKRKHLVKMFYHTENLTLVLEDASKNTTRVTCHLPETYFIRHEKYTCELLSGGVDLRLKISHADLRSNCKNKSSVNIKKIRWTKGLLEIRGNAFIHKLDTVKNRPKITLLIKGREKTNRDAIITIPATPITNDRITKDRKNDKVDYKWSSYKVLIDFSTLLIKKNFSHGYWDLFICIEIGGKKCISRLGRPTGKVKNIKGWNEFYPYVSNSNSVIPYFTPKNCISVLKRDSDPYETKWLPLKEKLAILTAKILKPFVKNKIWLTWETNSLTAQDNSYFLFRHSQNAPISGIELFYIIRKESPEYDKFLGNTQNVIPFLSLKHLVLLHLADGLVSSQTRQHGYIFRAPKTQTLQVLNSKPFIFLQHGVTAFKAVRGGQPALNKSSAQNIDKYIVTSKFEQNIVCDILGYSREDTPVLGFTRFDNLYETKDAKKQILLIPTWREWLEFDDKITESDFFMFYQSLLESKELDRILEKYDITLKFYMHIKLSKCLSEFDIKSPRIQPIQPGEEDVAKLIRESSLMITDHSSVAWDFFYQGRPVIFCHFDDDKHSSLNPKFPEESYLFGPKCKTIASTISEIEKYASNQFNLESKYKDKYVNYFGSKKDTHCEDTLRYISEIN